MANKKNRRKRQKITGKNMNNKNIFGEDFETITFSCSEELGTLFEEVSENKFLKSDPEAFKQASHIFTLRSALEDKMKEQKFNPPEISDLLNKYICIQYEAGTNNCSKVFANLDVALYVISDLFRKNEAQYSCMLNFYNKKQSTHELIKLERIYELEIIDKKTGKSKRFVPLGISENEYNKMPQSILVEAITDKTIDPEGFKVMDIYYHIKNIMINTKKLGY